MPCSLTPSRVPLPSDTQYAMPRKLWMEFLEVPRCLSPTPARPYRIAGSRGAYRRSRLRRCLLTFTTLSTTTKASPTFDRPRSPAVADAHAHLTFSRLPDTDIHGLSPGASSSAIIAIHLRSLASIAGLKQTASRQAIPRPRDRDFVAPNASCRIPLCVRIRPTLSPSAAPTVPCYPCVGSQARKPASPQARAPRQGTSGHETDRESRPGQWTQAPARFLAALAGCYSPWLHCCRLDLDICVVAGMLSSTYPSIVQPPCAGRRRTPQDAAPTPSATSINALQRIHRILGPDQSKSQTSGSPFNQRL